MHDLAESVRTMMTRAALVCLVWCLLWDNIFVSCVEPIYEFPAIDPAIYPVCTEAVYKQGNPDMHTTLYNCMNNISYLLQLRGRWTNFSVRGVQSE